MSSATSSWWFCSAASLTEVLPEVAVLNNKHHALLPVLTKELLTLAQGAVLMSALDQLHLLCTTTSGHKCLHLLQRWEGEQEWFPGQIEAWDPAGSTYTVSLQPSCTCSFAAVIVESSM